MFKERFLRLPIIVHFLQLTALGWGKCPVCGMPKKYCDGHDVMVGDNDGISLICEHCWQTKNYENVSKAFIDYIHDSYTPAYPHTPNEYIKAFEREWLKSRGRKKDE